MAGQRYNVTVKRRVPGAKWRRVFVGPKGSVHLGRRDGDRGAFWKGELKNAEKWAAKRLLKIRVVPLAHDPFKSLEKKHSLKRSSGDNDPPGSHARGSYHFRWAPWGGREAYDYGTARNTITQLRAAANDARKEAHKWAEVFGPFPWYVKNGVVYQGQFPNHGDHLHLARTVPA